MAIHGYKTLFYCLSVALAGATTTAGAQAGLCNCIAAWQQHTATPAGCPVKDSLHSYDRTGNSYLIFQGKDNSAESRIKEVANSIKTCIGKDYKIQESYDPVQMNQAYAFIPATPAGLRMELRTKSHGNQSAILLQVVQPAPLPGGDAAFTASTQQLLGEWTLASKKKSIYTGPSKGWAALYPAATFTGIDKQEKKTVYAYSWKADNGDGNSLQAALLKALGNMQAVAGNAVKANEEVPGKHSTTSYRLLPPNAPLIFEVSYEPQTATNIVSLRIIEMHPGN